MTEKGIKGLGKRRNYILMKGLCKITLFAGLFLVFVLGLNHWLYFKDNTIWSGDERTRTYQTLPENSVDVLFVGSSNVMCGINPVILWEEEGISAYNLATRAQTLPFAYLYLKEAFKSQSPKYVILDAYFVIASKEQYGLVNDINHLNMNMSALPFSIEKTELIDKYIPFRERINYYAPFVLYHSRWKTALSVQPDNPDIFLGFCCGEDDVKELVSFEDPVTVMQSESSEMDAIDYEYLDKIIRLCEENNAEIIFIKTPIYGTDEQFLCLQNFGEVLKVQGGRFLILTT